MSATETMQLIFATALSMLGLGGGAAFLRRRLSRDRTEMTKDRTESRFVELLLEERDRALASAKEAWKGAQMSSEAIARLGAQNAHQAGEIDRLVRELERLKRTVMRLYPETREFLATDFQPLTKELPS